MVVQEPARLYIIDEDPPVCFICIFTFLWFSQLWSRLQVDANDETRKIIERFMR